MNADKEHAQQLLNHLAPDQIAAVVHVMEVMLDPLSRKGDVKQLQGIEPPELRLRLGDYRVRFYDLGESIQILRVRHRKDAYR